MKRRLVYGILLLLLAGAAVFLFLQRSSRTIRLDPEGLYVLFLDVGQGDCALLMQGGHAMLVDTGISDYQSRIEEALSLFGIQELDAMLLTHPHADHIGSAAAIAENYTVDQIFMPNAVTTTVSFDHLLDAIQDKDIPVTVPEPGDTWQLGSAEITFLSPPFAMEYEDLNDSSIVFRICHEGRSMLFTGDMGSNAEAQILEAGFDVRCDLIKVPHHGSRHSSSWEFVQTVRPDYAVFTTVRDSEDGLPKQEIIDRYREIGASLYFTHESGSIWAEVEGGILRVFPFHPEQLRQKAGAAA